MRLSHFVGRDKKISRQNARHAGSDAERFSGLPSRFRVRNSAFTQSPSIMRTSKSLARIRSGGIIRTAVLGHVIPSYICHAARAGYDCIWLDLEHRGMDQREVQSLLALFHLFDIDCLLRAPTLEKTGLYRYLEDGATGLMIPHVSTPELAQQLVQAVKFPPLGNRGMDNAGLDSGYRVNPDYHVFAEWANRETFLTVQIETPEAVENCEEIIAIDGVDMIFVGPGDLGLRLRLAGDTDGSQLEAAFKKIAAACAKQGKPWGCPAMSPEDMQHRKDQGAQLLANFGEYLHLQRGLENAVRQFDELS